MIAVVGTIAYEERDRVVSPAGLAAEIALAAAQQGARVEVVAKVGEDAAGDALMLALSERHVGHAALLRDASRSTPLVVRREPAPAAGAEGAEGDEIVEIVPGPDERPVLDRGDISLALRYLPDLRVVLVVAGDAIGEDGVDAATEGAAFAGGRLVLVAPQGFAPELEERSRSGQAIVLEAPAEDDGSFARFAGAFAAGLDAGRDPAAAFTEAIAESGWERVAE